MGAGTGVGEGHVTSGFILLRNRGVSFLTESNIAVCPCVSSSPPRFMPSSVTSLFRTPSLGLLLCFGQLGLLDVLDIVKLSLG